jgi:pimeloyl-ACP methyl ester carboxylesterase
MQGENEAMKFLFRMLPAVVLGIGGCTSLSDTSTAATAANSKPTLVLVHGAFQDARAWDAVVPMLQRRGLQVVTVNLPGREGDGIDPHSVTLDQYRDAVMKTIDSQTAPVVLVGHSFGGITISNVAEAAPEKVKTLVYVAAYLPEAGAADQSMAKLSETDQWNRFNKERQNFILAADYSSASVLADDQVMLFCADCSDAAKRRTQQLMQREPLTPAATPVQLTVARYGSVPKVYIHTTRDNAVSFTLQQRMVARTAVLRTITLDTGHSPFLEAPDALADAISGAAQ